MHQLFMLFVAFSPLMVNGYRWDLVSSAGGMPDSRNMLTHTSSRYGTTGVCKFKHPEASFWRSGRIVNNVCYALRYYEENDRIIHVDIQKALPFEVMAYEPLADRMEWEGRSTAAIRERGIRVHPSDEFPTYVCAHPEQGVGAMDDMEPLVNPNVCWINDHVELCSYDKCPVLVNSVGVAYAGERIQYNLADMKTTDRQPIFGQADVFRNVNGNEPIVATLRASITSTATSSWYINKYFNINTEMSMRAGVPLFWSGEWYVSAEYTYETAYNQTFENVTTSNTEIQVTVNPGFECYLVSIHTLANCDVPYTAQMTTRYADGSYRGPETVEGIYEGMPVKESYNEHGCCPLVGGVPDCDQKVEAEIISEHHWTVYH